MGPFFVTGGQSPLLRVTSTLKAAAGRQGIRSSQVREWRRKIEENGRAGFLGVVAERDVDQTATIKELYAKIGEITQMVPEAQAMPREVH